MHTIRLAVITDASGTVLGTQQLLDTVADAASYLQHIPSEEIPATEVERIPSFSRIVAGPDQQEHEIEIDLPEQLVRDADAAELHRIVQATIDQLRPRADLQ